MSMRDAMGFGSALTALGVDLPDEAVAAAKVWNAATSMQTGDPIAALREAAQTGRLDADSVVTAMVEAAQAISVADNARGLVAELDFPLNARFAAAIVANGDGIVDQLRPRFDHAAKTLTAAAAIISTDADPERVLQAGPDAAVAWADLDRARATLDAIAEVRLGLTRRWGYGGPDGVVVFIADAHGPKGLTTAEHLWRGIHRAERLAPARGGTWQYLVAAGHELRLNTAREASIVAALRPLDPEPVAA